MMSNNDLELPCSDMACPDQQEMPRAVDTGARIYFPRIWRTITGLMLVMAMVMWTISSNFESLKIERAVDHHMSAANTHMHRRLMEDSADTLINISAYEGIDQTLLSFLSKSSYAREKVIEMVIDQYTSSSSPYGLLPEQLDNAIEAIDLVETDGEPIHVKEHPFLFVGSVGEVVIHCHHWRLPLCILTDFTSSFTGASLNHEALLKNGITYVINLSSSAKCNVFDDIEYRCISGIRGSDEMRSHLAELDEAVELIESTRKSGGRVMSQCWYGRNRR